MKRAASVLVVTALGVACANLDGLAGGGAAGDGGTASASSSSGGADAGSIVTATGLQIQPAFLDFDAHCGAAAATNDVVVTNTTSKEQKLSFTAPAAELFTLTGDAAITTLAAGASARIHVAPASNAIPGVTTDELGIVTESSIDKVRLTSTVHGAALAIEPSTLDFGTVHTGVESAPIAVAFQNTGDEPLTVKGFDHLGSDFTAPPSTTVGPGEPVAVFFTMNADPKPGDVSVTATAAFDGPTCGAAPTMTLKGSRSNDPVLVSPAALDFGSHGCNTSPGQTASITISNYSTTSTTDFTAQLINDSAFRIVSGAMGTVPKAANVTTAGAANVVLGLANTGATPKNVAETLTIRIKGAPDHPIKLTHLVTGAIIQLGAPPAPFDTTTHRVQSPPITNVGNVQVCVRYNLSTGKAWTVEDGDTLGPNVANGIDLTFTAEKAGTYDGTVTIEPTRCGGGAVGGPSGGAPNSFCTPAPTLSLSGTRGPLAGP